MSEVTMETMRHRCHLVLDMLETELPESRRTLLLSLECLQSKYSYPVIVDDVIHAYPRISRRMEPVLADVRAAIDRWEDIARLFYRAFEKVAAGADFWRCFLDAFEEAVRRDCGLTIPYDMEGRRSVHGDRHPENPGKLSPQRDGHYNGLIADVLQEREPLPGVPYCMHDILRGRPALDRLLPTDLVIKEDDPQRQRCRMFIECVKQEVRRGAARKWEKTTEPLWQAAEEKARIAAEKRSGKKQKDKKRLVFNPAWLLYGLKLVLNLVGMVLLRIKHEHLDWSLPEKAGDVFASFGGSSEHVAYMTGSELGRGVVHGMNGELRRLTQTWHRIKPDGDKVSALHEALRLAASGGDAWAAFLGELKTVGVPKMDREYLQNLPENHGVRPQALQAAAAFIFRDAPAAGEVADEAGMPKPEYVAGGPVPDAMADVDTSPVNPDVPIHAGRL